MELHQGDLAACKRVYSLRLTCLVLSHADSLQIFNEVATPQLYRSVIVNEVEAFFRGVPVEYPHRFPTPVTGIPE